MAVDGSDTSLHAVSYAGGLAARERTVLHILNVQPEYDDYGMVPAYLSKKTQRSFVRSQADRILAQASKQLKASRVRYETHVAFGRTAEVIVRTARRLRCSSIVMGSRGLGAVGAMLIGSVANKVIHLTTVPVTLVK